MATIPHFQSVYFLLYHNNFRFLFIFGWLRVAETLYNPFGEDDEDFELNELLNRHFKVCMAIVEEGEGPPDLKEETGWSQTVPQVGEH